MSTAREIQAGLSQGSFLPLTFYSMYIINAPMAVPWLRRLVAGFPPRRPGFEPRSRHVGFMMDKVATGAGFLPVLRFPLPILIPPIAPHSFIIVYHPGLVQ
jgi:hypothetical protein